MPPITTNVSTLGIAKEVTKGTAVAPAWSLRATDLKPTYHASTYDDESFRGSATKVFGKVVGTTYGEYEWTGPGFIDDLGWPLAGILNDVSTTGASDPYTTTFALLNSGTQQPTTYTLTDYNGNNARALAYSVFDKLDLNFTADGLLTYTAHAVAATFATGTTPTATYTAETPQPNYRCTVTIGGATGAIVTDGSISFARTATPVYALGSQAANSVFAAGDLVVTGGMTLVYDTTGETVLGDYLQGTIVPLTFDWVAGANRELKVQMTQALIDDATLNRAQGKYAELAVKFTAIANTTDVGTSSGYSPAKVTTKTAVTSGTYK